jgi:hypothetical protein
MKTARYALLSLMSAGGHASAEAELRSAVPAAVCYYENVFLTTWPARSVIDRIDYSGASARVIVATKQWFESSQSVRADIARAIYCRIGVEHGSGRVDITNQKGSVYGTVINGDWNDAFAH